jgi:hypothetical protein
MRGTWRPDPPPRSPWRIALDILLLVVVILVVVYRTELMDEVKHLKIELPSPSPSVTARP